MAFLGPLLGGGASLVVHPRCPSAQNEPISTGRAFRKPTTQREEEGLAKSDRRDAYGNKLTLRARVGGRSHNLSDNSILVWRPEAAREIFSKTLHGIEPRTFGSVDEPAKLRYRRALFTCCAARGRIRHVALHFSAS